MELKTFAQWWNELQNEDENIVILVCHNYQPATFNDPAEWRETEVEVAFNDITNSIYESEDFLSEESFYKIVQAVVQAEFKA